MTTIELAIGTYAARGGAGLVPLAYDVSAESFTARAPVADIANASYGAFSRRHGLHYLVDEVEAGAVQACRLSDGTWQRLGAASTRGAAPCFVALDAEERRIAAANYASGSAAVFALDPVSGLPVEPARLLRDHGEGPNRDRQALPHAHCVAFTPDGGELLVVDLGADAIFAHPLDREGEPRVAYRAPPGSGPRHLRFHPRLPRAYLLSELASTLTVLDVAPDMTFAARAILRTVPQGVTGSAGGHIALDRAGSCVLVSNRGHDSIAAFALDAAGDARWTGCTPSGGAGPRMFALIEETGRLVVAHEEDGLVAAFALRGAEPPQATAAHLTVPGAAFVTLLPSSSARSR